MTTYYIAASGNDSNTGTDATHPWKTITKVNATALTAGDSVLFNGGDTFSGNLVITNNGTSTNPITISSYGTGNAIISAGNGTGIQVKDCSYVHLSNLTINGSGVTLSGSTTTTTSTGYGVDILSTATQATINTAYLTGHRIDNIIVSGCYYGIYVRCSAGGATTPFPKGFNDIRITNCTVHNCCITGIQAATTPANNATGPTAYSKNIYIGNCVVYNIYGDSSYSANWSGSGILLGNVSNSMIERCLAHDCGAANGNPGGGPVGIWFYESLNCIIQYCEVYNQTDPQLTDGGAYDFDGGCQNCIIQYCYSHDNIGPAVQAGIYTGSNSTINNTFRYNISQNDGRNCALGMCYREFSATSGNIFHNNTFYAATPGIWATNMVGFSTASFYNNIFLSGAGVQSISATSGTYAGNLYYRTDNIFLVTYNSVNYNSLAAFRAIQETVNGAPTGISTNPNLTSPGNASSVLPSNQVANITAYDPTSISPGTDAGVDMKTWFNIDPGPIDFHGYPNRKGSFDIGAVEYGAGALLGAGNSGEYLIKL